MKTRKKYFWLVLSFAWVVFTSQAQTNYLDSLLTSLEKSKEDTSRVNLLIDISNLCDEKDILQYANPALKLSEKLAYKKGRANALNNIGYYYFSQGDTQEALKYWFPALRMATEAGDKANEATLLNNIAFVYELQGLIEQSLEYNLQSLGIREKIGNKAELANSYNNLALLYNKLGDYNKALEFNFKSLKLRQGLKNNQSGLAQALNNIGINYASLKNPAEAFKYYRKSLEIRNAIHDSVGAAECMINIGTYYCEQKLYDTALVFYNQSLKIKQNNTDKYAVANILTAIGSTYLKKKDYQAAGRYALKSLALSRELGFPQVIRDASKVLSQVYKFQGKYREAFDMMVLFKDMSDSISKVEIRNSSVKKQMQFDFEKKEARSKAEQEKKDLLVKEEKQRQQTILYATVSGLGLALLLAIFIFRGYNEKRKANVIITKQKEEVEAAKSVIEAQKEIVDEKQKEILDSIHYAKRIQDALLASESLLSENLGGPGNYFVHFKPKDIVSGDFYWATEHNNRFYLAVCDSTGHGVPGAFMSLLNIGFLSEAIKEKNISAPGEIFNFVRKRLTESISQQGQKDGFDGILLCIDKNTRSISWSAAHNKPALVSGDRFIELDCDKMPVGKGEKNESFSTHSIEYKKGDSLYLYTDGYADQFGGPKGKKFKYKQLEDVLLSNASLSMPEQAAVLDERFCEWKGELEQVDDVLVIGIRF
jgi:serine phosphatase RsbU (regulator of sigma subunit)